MLQGMADRAHRVIETVERLGPIENPAPLYRKALQPISLPVPEECRRSRPVDLQNQTWPGTH
jgi:hypothetical protein